MSITLWKKSASDNQNFIPKATTATLDDLFAAANEIGDVEVGGISCKNQVEIKVHSELGLFFVKCKKYDTMKENLSECIRRAQYIKNACDNY